MNRTKPEISSAELEALVLDVFAAERRPLTVREVHGAIPKALRPPSKTVGAIVTTLVKNERLFRHGRRYAAEPDRTLHASIVRLTAEGPRAASDIAKRLRASASRVREVIRELVTGGELHVHPKYRYAPHPPSPADLLRGDLERLLASAAKRGIAEPEARKALRELLGGGSPAATPEQVASSTSGQVASTTNDEIVATIRSLEPDGALVYLPHLRTALASSFSDKPSFDRAVLSLLARGTIQLHSHPTPSLLGSAEREAMIADGRGGYYSAIGLR